MDKSTVSLVLRHDPRIPARTAERVHALAERLGYRPDPVLASAAAARWHRAKDSPHVTLAFVSQQRQLAVGGDWVLRAQAGIRRRALELGYALDSFCLEEFPDSRTLQKTLLARGIRGIIAGPFFNAGPSLDLDWRHFCVVGYGNGDTGPDPAFHTIQYDAFNAVTLAWRRVCAHGYQRPGLVVHEHDSALRMEDDARRRAAALLCQDRCAPGCRVPPLFVSLQTPYEAHVARVLAWYRKWKPDVVLDFNGSTLPILRHNGQVKVPAEVGFAQVSCVKPEQTAIAGVMDETEQLWRTAVDLLQQLLNANQDGAPAIRIRHDLAPKWKDGDSLPLRH